MGAFDDLTATSTEFGPAYDVMRKAQDVYGAATPEQCERVTALNAMRLDLQKELGLLPSDAVDMATLDDLATGQAALLRNVLAQKQLAFVLAHPQLFQGPGSRNYLLLKDARDAYDEYRNGFRGLASRRGSATTKTERIRR